MGRGRRRRTWILAWMLVWLAFLMPFVPWTPRIGRMEDGDCIFMQAFGRNGIPDEELVSALARLRAGAGGDDVAAFKALQTMGFAGGAANRTLSMYGMELIERYGVPLFGQWENIYEMFVADPAWYERHAHLLVTIWPEEEGYFNTYEVKRASVRFMRERGCSRPIEVAHPAMNRMPPTLWKAGADPIMEPVYPWNFWKHRLWVWDAASVQWWTQRFLPTLRDTDCWLKREVPGRYGAILVLGFFLRRPHYNWIALFPPRAE